MKRITRYEPKVFVQYTDTQEIIDPMRADEHGEWVKFDDIPSWAMLMDILDAVYPASVFTGESGDSAPGIIKKLREIDAIRRELTGDSER